MSFLSTATGAVPEVGHVRPAFRRDFHIAIICALPLEYDAASLLIDEFWDQGGQQYGRISGDSNTYRNGRIGMHNVVLMLLPSMGKVSVAGSAASLRASYVGVRLAFLVGVCGGVPGIREMILGDVVISDDLVQYDFGRQYPGAFVAKDTVQVHPGLSSKDVRSLVSYFRTESGKRDLQDDAAENLIGLQDSAAAKRYQSSYEYPGPGEDKLFEATYRHRHREPSSCEFCCGETERFCEKAAGMPCAELGCDTNRLVPRRRLEVYRHGKRQVAHGPEVFIGRVASADMVMKSGEHRDRFAEQYGVIAFEMEAAGIWDEVPCIVVKGVCDYADSHKSKSWQPFAAATAAAVTKSILNRYSIADNAQSGSDFTLTSQSDLSGDIDELNSVQPSASMSNEPTILTVVQDNQWKPLQDAIFHFRRGLTSRQVQFLQEIQDVPNADSVLVFTAHLDSRNRERKGSSIASRFYSALKSVRDFSAVIESSSCPKGLPVLLWASVKLTIKVIFGTTTHYDAVSRLFIDLGRLCPRIVDCGFLFPASAPLRQSLIKFYASLVRCCTDLLRFLSRPWYENFFGASQDLSKCEFKPHMDEIRRYSDAIEVQLSVAKNPTQPAKPKRNTTQRGPWLKGLFPKTGDTPGESGAWQLESDKQRARERRQQLLDSLSTHDYLTPLKQSRRKRHAGTAEWLFETEEFNEWINDLGFTVFWCSGKIGSGKTILVASLIDKLLTEKVNRKRLGKISVAFFFVRFDDQESTKADVILRSILRQAIDMVDFDNQIQTMLEKWQDTLLSEIEDVVQMLRGVISTRLRNFHIVIDGLDECGKKDRDSLMRGLFSIRIVAKEVRIFLCGRQSMSREVEKAFQPLIDLSMDCRPAEFDIPKYIESAVQERLHSEELIVGDQNLIDEIKEALKRGADGMFLWVVFQLDALCSQHCDDDIRQAIRDLPTDLTETFKRALRRIISRRNADMASKCFQWVAAANRPLSINELREAISIEIGQEYSKPERLPNNMRNISSFCENLVHVDEEKNIVQFAHHTVKQFLIDEISEPEFRLFHFKLEDVDHFIGEICVTYLNFNDFNTALVRRPKPPQHVVLSDIGRTVVRSEKKSHNLLQNVARLRLGAGKKPKAVDFVQALSSSKPQDATIATDGVGHFFLKYASENMMLHTKGFRKEKSLMWSQWKRMIIDGSDLFQYPWGTGPFREDDPAVVKWSFDYNHLGLIRIINAYRGMSHTKEQNDSLCRAIETYNMDLVETLLASGSDPNAISDEGLPVLGIAASIGALDAVDKLLLAGAHVNRSEPDIIPALHLAARSGKANIVKKLIAEGAVVNALFHKMSALHLAGERGYREIVELLLAAGADLRIAEYGLMGIVLLAARCGHTEILSDPVVAWDLYQKLDDNQICSAIYTAVTSGHPDVVHRIVQIRFKPIDSGSMTNSMLRLAVECGHLGVAQFALAQGADANTVLLGKDLYVPVLQKAAELDRQDMVDTLLTAGANMDFCDGPEMILHIAVKHGSLKILEKALAADADVNAVLDKDESYTALHIAAKLAALKVLNRLMKEKKRPRSERQNDTSYSDLAAERVFLDIINKLLDAGADVDRKTERGQTPLQVAARHWGSLLSGVSTGFNSSRMTTDETRLDLEAVLRGSRHGYRARQPDDEELEM